MGILDSIFGNPAKKAAEEAARRERERQERLSRGRASINAEFGRFDDDFFGEARQSAVDKLTPELQQGFDDASAQSLFSAARSGNLGSSAAIQNEGRLLQNFAEGKQDIQNQADDFVGNLRRDIEGERANAIQLLVATEDPSVAASTAAARARAFSPSTGIQNLITPLVTNGLNAFADAQAFDRRLGIARNGNPNSGPLGSIFGGSSSTRLKR